MMQFSKTAKSSGLSCFFFDGDKNAPTDSITVKDVDVGVAINLPAGAAFDFDTDGAMSITPALVPSAAEIKTKVIADRWLSIKSERDRRKACGVKVHAYWFHSDAESKTQHLANKDTARDQIDAGGTFTDNLLDPLTGATIPWKTMSGEFVLLTCQLAYDIVVAAKASEFSTFRAAEVHKAAMEASADPAAYDFSAGWPATYVEATS